MLYDGSEPAELFPRLFQSVTYHFVKYVTAQMFYK